MNHVEAGEHKEEILVDIKRLDTSCIIEPLRGRKNVVFRGVEQLRLTKHVVSEAGWEMDYGMPEVIGIPVRQYLREVFETIDEFEYRGIDDLDGKFWVWNPDPDEPIYGSVLNRSTPDGGETEEVRSIDDEDVQQKLGAIADVNWEE